MMTIKRALLALVTGVVPVFIAACYGIGQAFTKSGRVVDKQTGAGIGGINVGCAVNLPDDAGVVSPAADPVNATLATTAADGGFAIGGSYVPCQRLAFTDTDGAANGGLYATVTAPMGEEADDLVVEMERSP